MMFFDGSKTENEFRKWGADCDNKEADKSDWKSEIQGKELGFDNY